MENRNLKESLVFDKNGLRGKIIRYTTSANANRNALIDLGHGQQVVIPVQNLVPRKTAGFDVAGLFEEWCKTSPHMDLHPTHASEDVEHNETISIPVIEEELEVQKRQVDTGTVRINKTITEREETVNQELSKETAKIERVPINRIVKEAADSRYENNTWIIPVYEEVVITEKRLMLREEIHITKEISVEHHHERIPLRSEIVTVDKSNEN